MPEYISVKVISLKELFSDTYRFRLPFFQRAYAWQTNEVGRLLASIIEAMNVAEPRGYFLGKLMLAKRPGDPDTALVDGHQRLMSLTILFAVLRDLEGDKDAKAWLDALISGSGYRLAPQATLADFCHRYVQTNGATLLEPEEDMSDLSETERNILDNRNFLRSELTDDEMTPEIRRRLARFLAARCCVIVSAVEDEDEAWRILRIEEDTRLEFNKTSRAKASLLSIVPHADRAEAQTIWERCESLLGAADLYALLDYLQAMKLRKHSRKPVEITIAEQYEFDKPRAGLAFLEQTLLPAAEAAARIRRLQAAPPGERTPAGECMDRMSWINAHNWLPPAIVWLSRSESEKDTALFFRRLERLVWLLRISDRDPATQQRRMLTLAAEIERGTKIADMREFDISRAIRTHALSNLRSVNFDARTYYPHVLRRISIALGQDPGPIHPKMLTVEHILPRSWAARSGWRQHFPARSDVKNFAHRLGNLTFLTEAENQAADTRDWSEKRRVYANSRLVLSNRLGATVSWTTDTIVSRTDDMIRILFEAWDLKL